MVGVLGRMIKLTREVFKVIDCVGGFDINIHGPGTGTGIPNRGGHQLNFDLAYPSPAIPDDFFPSDVSLYGYTVSWVLIYCRFLLI